GPRSLDGLRRPRSLRYSPHRHWRGPPLGAASRHPPFPLSLPRGERPSTCPPSPPNQGFIFATNGVNCISDWSPQVCYRCLKRKAGKGDDSRGDCYFCSDACREHAEGFHGIQKKVDWSLLDDHCSSRGLKYPYMVRRLACMVISGDVGADCLDILQPAQLHQGTLIEMEEEFELLKSTFRKAGFQEELTTFLTKQWYINILARIRVNAFRIELVASSYEDLLSSAVASVTCDASVGNAVYMLPSFYNHDCDPNTHIVWLENADAKLKTLRDIDEGEELRICYIDTSMDVNARQKILTEGFGFQCRCQRCLSGD
uniref:SET domain-containing protein n=1 Tax=Aegilops tauschii subsp. strangulata TaxID=200361 RepID=A0A453SK12_AEGTS